MIKLINVFHKRVSIYTVNMFTTKEKQVPTANARTVGCYWQVWKKIIF
jgi:hypothetical protein